MSVLVVFPAAAIVVRHDVPPESFVAEPADYPSVFGIYRGHLGQPDCLATLIDPQWAITAAHCTQDPPLIQALEDNGVYPVVIAGQDRAIAEVVRHPSWQGRLTSDSFDLALVRLANPVTDVPPLPLATESDEVGRTVLVVGWGDPGTGLTGPLDNDGTFRLARNRVDGADERWLWWSFDEPGDDRTLPMEGISGPGDSGGPAFLEIDGRLVLAGISSSQRTGGRPEGHYGVVEYYARISSVIGWIDSIVGRTSVKSRRP